jgi:AcrR family transcriptional regulator
VNDVTRPTPPSTRRETYHHGDLKDALLAAVVGLVRDEGLDAVSIRSVARLVGVSEAAPYHHFANKADLLAGAAIIAFEEFTAALSAAIEAAELVDEDPTIGLAECWVRFGLERPGEYGLMFGRHIVDLGLEHRHELQTAGGPALGLAAASITRSLARRGSDVSLEEAFPMVWACLHGTTSLAQEKELGADFTVADAVALVRRTVTALLDGLSVRDGSS